MRIPKQIAIREKDIPRFWKKVNKHADGCWEWNAYVSPNGHGRFSVDGVSRYAHRFSYVLHKGEIPAGLFIRHLCNNPACVNPSHLETGTHVQNMMDKAKAGSQKGSRHNNAVLKEADVIDMRTRFSGDSTTIKELSIEYDVHAVTVAAIVSGRTWQHAGGETISSTAKRELRAEKIKSDISSGKFTQREIAKRYGMTEQTISSIARGKIWKD